MFGISNLLLSEFVLMGPLSLLVETYKACMTGSSADEKLEK